MILVLKPNFQKNGKLLPRLTADYERICPH